MILMMLNQRWMFKSVQYKNIGKLVYQEKVGRFISESAFVVLNYVILTKNADSRELEWQQVS